MNEENFTLEPTDYKPLDKYVTQKDTLQHILSRKKCDIPKDCFYKYEEKTYSRCKFINDCNKYRNYLHPKRERIKV